LIGQGLLHGKVPYRDVWDIKPPGIYYVYALIVKIFGPVMWCLGVVDILWLLLISCCIFYFARRYLGTPAAALAMIFNAAWHCWQEYNHAAQAETFLMLCVFAAWFMLAERAPSSTELGATFLTHRVPSAATAGLQSERRGKGWTLLTVRCFTAGLLLGAAFWFKYNALIFFPFLLLLPFLDFCAWDRGSSRVHSVIPWKNWLVRVSIVAAGFSLAILGVLVHFWAAGGWQAFKETQFEVLPRFLAGHFQWRFSQENLTFFVLALRLTQYHLGFWTEITALLTLLIAWRRRELRFIAPVFLLALAGYACAAVQGQFNSYYFETCYPFLSIFWGYVCVKTWEGFQYTRTVLGQHGWSSARAMLWLVLAGLVSSLVLEERIRVVQHYQYLAVWWRNPQLSYQVYSFQYPLTKLSQQLRVIDYLKENSNPEDKVFVWGYAPLINYLGQRKNPSRFVYDFPLISNWGLVSWRQELVCTLETERPRYIVVERNDPAPICTHTILSSEQCLRLGTYPAMAKLMSVQYKPAVNFLDFEVYELKKSPGYAVRTSNSEGQD
jgi:hypothetical protein